MEFQDIFQPDKPSSTFGKGEEDSHLVKIKLVTALCYTTWNSGLFLLFLWCHESCSAPWQGHSLSLFASCPSQALLLLLALHPSKCQHFLSSLQLPSAPVPFLVTMSPVLALHIHWLALVLGTDINILLKTAQSLFIHLGNASLIIKKPWTERRDKLLNQSSTNDFVTSAFRIVSTITLQFQGLCSNQLLWDRKQRFLFGLLYFPACISTPRRTLHSRVHGWQCWSLLFRTATLSFSYLKSFNALWVLKLIFFY